MTVLLGFNTVGTDGNDFEIGGSGTAPMIASQFVAGATGTIDTITLRTNSGNACNSVCACIFADSAGNPAARIGNVVTFALTTGVTSYQTSGPGVGAAVTSGTTYWIAFQSQTASNLTVSLHDATTASGTKDTGAVAQGMITPWGTTVGTFTELMNAFASDAGAVAVSAQPVFLPRQLGPKAVGPTFFAPLQPYVPQVAQPQAAPVWIPATTFSAPRNRAFFSVRGRQVAPVPAQVIVPPAYPVPRVGQARRLAALARGRQSNSATMSGLTPINPPMIYAPLATAGHQFRRVIARKVRRADPPWHQTRVPSAPKQRAKTLPPRRGRQTNPVLTQASVITPTWPPGKLGAARRPALYAIRGRRTMPVPAQVTIPVRSPTWRRGQTRPSVTRRGHRYDPAWPITTSPIPPAPPTICYPTTATFTGPDTGASYTVTLTSAAIPGQDTSASLPTFSMSAAIPGQDTSASVTGIGTSAAVSGADTSASVTGADTGANIKVCGLGP